MLHCIARLDYDSREDLADGVQRMRFVYSLPGVAAHRFRLRRFRTRRGWHVEIYTDARLSPLAMVALQAVLGSDYRREGFNLFRACMLPHAPGFWRHLPHWNVLHREKLSK